MRQIKFRGKRKDYGYWLYGDYCSLPSSTILFIGEKQSVDFERVVTETVGQFTGSYDKNEKDAYHKDIVKYGSNIGVIEWDNIAHSWCIYLMERDAYSQLIDGEYEIIGNIHDNPELLTK